MHARSFLIGLSCLAAWCYSAAGQAPSPPAIKGRALLIGCTTYDNLDPANNLDGPANDVKLFRKLLRERFGFEADRIVTLAEAEGRRDLRPIRANIEREFKALAAAAQAGESIVILMGGHGTQQPNDDPADLTDPEPDGLDEVFLPADVAPWSSEVKSIVNAVKDDELRQWLTRIRDKGAFVWFIADCCHSGTISRDLRTNEPPIERNRELRPDLLVPKEVLAAAQNAASKTRGGERVPDAAKGIIDSPGAAERGELVAMYAAQSTEPTVERRLPDEADPKERLPYGLLTFTINQLLTRATEPMSYRDLVLRVHQQYVAWGRSFPTPLIEGNGADRPLLGSRDYPARSLMTLTLGPSGYRVTAGAIHGLTRGSILAILPPAGEAGGRLGFVRVKSCGVLDSDVEPVEYEGQPAARELPRGARAEVIQIDAALSPTAIAVIDDRSAGGDQFRESIKARITLPPNVLQIVAQPQDAKWIVRAAAQGITIFPAGVDPELLFSISPAAARALPILGPYPITESEAAIAENISKIARVEQLLSLAEPFGGGRIVSGNVNVALELRRYQPNPRVLPRGLAPIDLSGGAITLEPGEQIDFRIVNKGRVPADVTLIYIDENFGIISWYPKPGTTTDNRIQPGEDLEYPHIDRGELDPDTVGKQHMLLIATTGEGPPRNFTWLEQPSIQKARLAQAGERGNESVLSELFKHATYGSGTQRGMKAKEAEACAIRTISWQFSPLTTAAKQEAAMMPPAPPPNTKSALTGAAREILERAESIEIFLLKPEKASEGDRFRDYPIMAKATIDPAARKAAFVTMIAGMLNDGQRSRCFIPHHGLRATHQGRTVEMVICFECNAADVYSPDGTRATIGMGTPGRDSTPDVARTRFLMESQHYFTRLLGKAPAP